MLLFILRGERSVLENLKGGVDGWMSPEYYVGGLEHDKGGCIKGTRAWDFLG